MKTNQVLTRKMGQFDVLQRTSDGMFNATVLLKQWNEFSGAGKKLDHYFENKSTDEFVNTIESKENLNTRNSVYLKTRGKHNGGTWMHPLLFIDFAMWINPSFKYDVLKFVYDQLIQYRNEAGDTYKDMCSAIASISKKDEVTTNITRIAKAINIVIFGEHQKEARNKFADETPMRELTGLQSEVTKLINLGYLRGFEQVREYLLRVWNMKNQPKELAS